MSLQRLGTKHMTSTACWDTSEKKSTVIIGKEASSDHVSIANQPSPSPPVELEEPRRLRR